MAAALLKQGGKDGKKNKTIPPYIPNSAPEIQAKMMEYSGIRDVEELYADLPQHLRFKGEMNLADAIPSEYELKTSCRGHSFQKSIWQQSYQLSWRRWWAIQDLNL